MPEDTFNGESPKKLEQSEINDGKWQEKLKIKPNVAEYIINSPRPIDKIEQSQREVNNKTPMTSAKVDEEIHMEPEQFSDHDMAASSGNIMRPLQCSADDLVISSNNSF